MMFRNTTRVQPKPGQDRLSPMPQYTQILKSFKRQEIRKLKELREQHQCGALNEWPADYKRLRFARWLYRNGKYEG